MLTYLIFINIYCSLACAINLGTTVIITGGYYSTDNTVTEYSEDGFVRDLPGLLEWRINHGCSYYDNEEGTKVDFH